MSHRHQDTLKEKVGVIEINREGREKASRGAGKFCASRITQESTNS